MVLLFAWEEIRIVLDHVDTLILIITDRMGSYVLHIIMYTVCNIIKDLYMLQYTESTKLKITLH